MQQPGPPRNRVILDNVAWFLGALGMALLVWMIATTQLNPVEERRLREPLPIRVAAPDGLVVTNTDEFARTATALIRAQQSVWELLTADDILVSADLTDLGPGEHTVELEAQIARPARIVDISPRQITVELEQIASRLVEVRADIQFPPPFGFAVVGDPTFDVPQVTVTGPQSKVEQVAAAQVSLDLRNQRMPTDDFARPIPVDADGNAVTGVTVDTQIIGVSVDIQLEAE